MKQKPTLNDLKLVINKWGGRNIPTVYLEGESWYEVLQILANKVYGSLEWIDGYFNTDLESIVEKLLNEWIDDGTIQVIISKTLQGQLDEYKGLVNKQLAQTENEVNEMNNRLSSQLAQTATKEELNDIGVSQINKNKGLIDETYLSDTLKSQIIGQTELGQTVPDNSVTLIKTAFSEVTSDNIFNKDEAVRGALGSTGNIVENSSFYTSGFIRVTQSDIVNTTNNMQNYAFYDTDKTFVSGLGNAGVATVTVPSGAYYIRVSFYHTNLNTFMLSIGELPDTYVPFKRAIHGRHLDRIDGDSIVKGTLPIQTLENLTVGKNLLDVTKSVEGLYLNNGVLSPNSSLSTSNYIEVTPSTDYVPTSQRVVEFYDSGKNLLEAISEASYPVNKTVTSPPSARFMRISYRTSDKHFMQLEQGSGATTFEPFGYKIPNLLIDGQNVTNATDNIQTSEGIINLASPLHATVGEELNIYHDNILKEYTDNYNLRYTCELGGQFDEGYKLTPQSTGTYPLTVLLYEGSKLINSKTVDVVAVNPRTTKKDVLFIGDSLVNQNLLTQRLIDKLGSNINLIGTRGTAPNKHEGRSGWNIARYRTNQSADGVANPFYNGDFDFNYYMTNNAINNVDVVVITLGTNDTFNFGSDEAILSGLNNITQNLDYIVNNIKSYNPNIKIAINLTIPPNAKQQKFGEQKLAGTVDQTRWRYKYNNAIWVNQLISRYPELDLINTHVNINTETEIADHIHPNIDGYNKFGDVIYNYINAL